jgi:sulfonate transport system permease protein
MRALPWVLPCFILAAWVATSHFGLIPIRILPAPTEVVEAAFRLIRSAEIFRHIAVSSARAFAGLAVVVAFGFLLGLLNDCLRLLIVC